MANRVVALLLRVSTLPNRPYLKPFTSANGTVRPLWAIHDGKPVHFPEGSAYYLRYKQGSKLIFERIGPHLDEALASLARKRNLLEGVILGNQPAPVATSKVVETELESAIETYLEQVGAASSQRTAVGYKYALQHFRKFMELRGKLTVESVDTADMVAYVVAMQKEGLVERTQFNRLASLQPFLRVRGREKIYPRSSWPRFVEKEPEAFTREELSKLFDYADDEDRLVFRFFLFTGLREAELSHATWKGINWELKTYTVTEQRASKQKLAVDFKPKSRRERSIPLPDDLVAALWERKQARPGTQLIFANGQGGVEGHFLRRLKAAAWRAGLNCGECQDEKGWSCANHPNCSRWQLHTFRRSFATLSHESGISARSIQQRLGHVDLVTTLRYLRAAENTSPAVRSQVNSLYSGLIPNKPMLVA